MWAITTLDTITLGTFSSRMHLLSIFLLGMLTMISNIAFGLITATMTLFSNLFTTLVLEPVGTAIKGVQGVWNICKMIIPVFSSQVAGFLYKASPSFSKLLVDSLPSLPHYSDNTATGYPCAILYVYSLAQQVTQLLSLILPHESAIPLSTMKLFCWLSQPIDGTARTRADSIADACARKCGVNQSHTTAAFVALGYLLAACAGLSKLVQSDANSIAFMVMIWAIWFLRPVINEQTIDQIIALTPLKIMLAQVKSNKEFHFGIFWVRSEKRGQINQVNGSPKAVIESESMKDHTIRLLQQQIARFDQTNTRLSTGISSQINNQTNNQINTRNRNATQQHQAHITRLNNALNRANTTTATLMGRTASLESELSVVRQDYAALLNTRTEAHFESHLAKHISLINDIRGPCMISDFAVPFVLVLVDGDAYGWAASLYTKSSNPPGAKAAQAIKDEVRKYIFDNRAQIPLPSRIVVRVFQNIWAGDIPVSRLSLGTRKLTQEFARDFTESMPLFDYIDCGTGKERADSKIQELAHLFIANPACHAVFLAAAKDNGFARLLEQYSCDAAVRDKIVVVHPGYIIREIDALGFKSVEWSSVFKRQYMPADSRQKAANMARAARKREEETETATAKFVFENTWKELGKEMDKFERLSRGTASGKVRDFESKEGDELVVGCTPEID